MREYDINITGADIRNGIRGSVTGCPTALAMERAGLAGIYIPTASLPAVAQNFIRDFDAGRPVYPMTFTVWADGSEPAPRVAPGRAARFEPVRTAQPAPRNYYGNPRPLKFEAVPTAPRRW